MRTWVASLLFLAVPGLTDAAPSVQEVLLRAKPAVALVVSEVAAEVTVTCRAGGKQQVSPAPFRETGTGWFINPNGWLGATVSKYSPPVAGEAMSGRDLALLKLEAADMPALSLGDSSNAKSGDRIHILGFPGVVLTHEL